MPALTDLTAITNTSFANAVQTLYASSVKSDPLLVALLRASPAPKTTALGAGHQVFFNVKKIRGQWYRGGSPTTSTETPMPRAGIAQWYFHKTPITLYDDYLQQNAGVTQYAIMNAASLSAFDSRDRVALVSLVSNAIRTANESKKDDLANALQRGGVGNDGNPSALGMIGLDDLFNETKAIHGVGIADLGTFEADDPWAITARGQASLNLNEPCVYREGSAGAAISYALLNEIIRETMRYDGERFCELPQDLYHALEAEVHSQYDLVPDGRMNEFGFGSFKIGDVTFVPGMRAPAGKARIVTLGESGVYLQFGMVSNGGIAAPPTGGQAAPTGAVSFPCWLGSWDKASNQEGISNGLYFTATLVCSNRRALVEVRNLTT
jgi:hypothetical protein